MDEECSKRGRPFSVLMSVFAREEAANLVEALESLARSDEPPVEVVLVEDGPLTQALHAVIDQYRSGLPIVSVKLTTHEGLAHALNAGLKVCHCELVARFDSDDISLPSRFTEQLDFLALNPEVAAVGAWVEEFERGGHDGGALRVVPANPAELAGFSKLRNPLNHPTVMFRRSVVLQVGGYQQEAAFEDYSLWLRLMRHGAQLANIPKVLVKMRAGAGQTQRRMGLRYAAHELQFAAKFLKLGHFSAFEYMRFVLYRVPLRLLPISLLRMAYLRLARSQPL